MSTADTSHLLSNVTHEGGRVTIENVKPFSPGDYASSTHGALITALHAVGESISYAQAIGADGLAFRMQMHKAICPSSPHACCGHECVRSAATLPWRFDVEMFQDDARNAADFEDRKASLKQAVRANIDRGIPVPFASFEEGVIFGYEDDGERWLCKHPYHKWGKEPFVYGETGNDLIDKHWPFAFVLFSEPKAADERTPLRELAESAMRQAVAMWYEGWSGEYAVGDQAYAVWLDWLRGVEDGTVDNPKAGMQGNGWVYDSLSTYRKAASTFLREAADEFNDAARPHIVHAAHAYDAMVNTLTDGIDCPWSLTKDPGKVDEWTSELRREQIDRVEAAREHDRDAIKAIKAAFEALGENAN